MATENQPPPGLDALRRLKTLDPPQWLAPSPELSREVREASHYLFSSLKPFAPKSPFEKLLVEGFDAEQIWQQIDLQSLPLMSSLRRDVRRLEKNPEEILKVFGQEKVAKPSVDEVEDEEEEDGDDEFEDFDEGMEDFDEDGDDEESEDDEEEEEEEEEEEGKVGIEDDFFKVNELNEFLEEDEEREYGLKLAPEEKKKKKKKKKRAGESDDEEDEDEEDFELEALALDGDGSEDGKEMQPRYEDFYGREKKKDVKRKSGLIDGSEDSDTGDEQENRKASKTKKKGNLSTHEKEHVKPQSEIKQMENKNLDTKSSTMQGEKNNLSTYEKERVKLQSKIKQMEIENMDAKSWAMQGEVTADKRPMNSLLAANLDYDHSVKPAPVITEKVTESIEDLIKKRILEGHFDDVQKTQSLSSKAPKERKELDENKSKKGLGEIYEDDYAQKVNPDSAPLTFSDERKKEATLLFKTLSLKLDALSHFHFSPKPVIDDMSIKVNVPALAMEEIAPVAVSDAAMLAPEEVFTGKGDIKEDAELSQAERKRRRANKKRKFKAVYANKVVKKARESSTSLDAKDTAR